jgi:hypothetical protein
MHLRHTVAQFVAPAVEALGTIRHVQCSNLAGAQRGLADGAEIVGCCCDGLTIHNHYQAVVDGFLGGERKTEFDRGGFIA